MDTPELDRPMKLVLDSDVDRDAAQALVKLVHLCRSTLQEIALHSHKRHFLRSEHVSNMLLCDIAHIEGLKTLSLERVFLAPKAIEGLTTMFRSETCQVRNLSIAHSLVYSPQELADMIAGYGGLEELSISGCEFGDERFKILSVAIEQSPSTLKHLNISSNCLTKESLPTVSRVLRGQKNLQELNLSRNEMFLGYTEDVSDPFRTSLVGHKSLQVMKLNCSGLNASSIGSFLAAVEGNDSLLYLQLSAQVGDIQPDQDWLSSLPRATRLRSKLITTYWTEVDENSRPLIEKKHSEEKLPDLLDEKQISSSTNLDGVRIISHNRLLHQISIFMAPKEHSPSLFDRFVTSFQSYCK